MDDEPKPVQPEDVKQVIVIRRDLKMRRGKEIAQGAHASGMFLVQAFTAGAALDEVAHVWLTTSLRKVTLQAHSEEQLVGLHEAAEARGLRSHIIRDSGRTEFGGVPTLTALAIGPDLATSIDEVTGDLTIY